MKKIVFLILVLLSIASGYYCTDNSPEIEIIDEHISDTTQNKGEAILPEKPAMPRKKYYLLSETITGDAEDGGTAVGCTDKISFLYENDTVLTGTKRITGGRVLYTKYTYDERRNIVKEQFYDSIMNPINTYTVFEYENDTLVKFESYSIKGSVCAWQLFKYSDNGFLNEHTKYGYEYDLTIDSCGNVLKTTRFLYSVGDIPVLTCEMNYNVLNPYKGILYFNEFCLNSHTSLNEQYSYTNQHAFNVKIMHFDGYEGRNRFEYKYECNEDGYPLVRRMYNWQGRLYKHSVYEYKVIETKP